MSVMCCGEHGQGLWNFFELLLALMTVKVKEQRLHENNDEVQNGWLSSLGLQQHSDDPAQCNCRVFTVISAEGKPVSAIIQAADVIVIRR